MNYKLKKIKTRVMKGASVDGQGRELPLEIIQEGPDKFVSSVTVREGAQMLRGYNGTIGWMSSPRGAREMSPEESEELKHEELLFPISRMRELSATIHVSGTRRISSVEQNVNVDEKKFSMPQAKK